jgi:hypothetical protein
MKNAVGSSLIQSPQGICSSSFGSGFDWLVSRGGAVLTRRATNQVAQEASASAGAVAWWRMPGVSAAVCDSLP